MRAGKAGGLIAAGATLESVLASCGGNVSVGGAKLTPGATVVPSDGLKNPAILQWGADYVSGAPYVFQDPSNPNHLIGFEEDIAQAMADLMSIEQGMIEVCYGNLEQALLANQIDMVMNGWEKTADRLKTELFSQAYYRYGQQVIIRKGDSRFSGVTITNVSQLGGYKVGTGAGYKAQDIMNTYNSSVSDPSKKITITAYSGNIAFSDLEQGKLDAFFLDNPIAAYYILGTGPGATPIPSLQLLGAPINIDDYFVGFNKSSANAQKLLPEIDECFTILKKNGKLKSIYQHWQMWNPTLEAQIGIM